MPLAEYVSLIEKRIRVAVLVHAVERTAAVENPIAAAETRSWCPPNGRQAKPKRGAKLL